MINGFWLGSFLLLAMTLGVIYFRYSAKDTNSNWPIIYYALALLHHSLFPEALPDNILYGAVITAALLRFEFMSGWFLKMVQGIEYLCLIYLGYRLTDIILF